eukprot:GHVP01066160.1.p1 GENE.GHVP01066160.1~~GHVP01066160.1.p1  ORF type:complete len:572 (-),score=74.59 GHVP01066160.1:581-2296(-)
MPRWSSLIKSLCLWRCVNSIEFTNETENATSSLSILRPVLTFHSTMEATSLNNNFQALVGRVALVDVEVNETEGLSILWGKRPCSALTLESFIAKLAQSTENTDPLHYFRRPSDSDFKRSPSNVGFDGEFDDLNLNDESDSLFASQIALINGCRDDEVEYVIDLSLRTNLSGLIFTHVTFDKVTIIQPLVQTLDSQSGYLKILPVFSCTDPLVDELTEALRSNRTTIVRMSPSPPFPCNKLLPVVYTSPIFISVWSVLGIFWYYQLRDTSEFELEITQTLDRILYVVPFSFAVVSALNVGSWCLCPHFSSRAYQFLLLGRMAGAICGTTLFYAMILLLSKGWRLLRMNASPRESLLVSVLISLVYIVESLGHVNSEIAAPGSIGLHFLLLVEVQRSIRKGIAFVVYQERFANANAGTRNYTEELGMKKKFLRVLMTMSYIYFLSDILVSIILIELLRLQTAAWILISSLRAMFLCIKDDNPIPIRQQNLPTDRNEPIVFYLPSDTPNKPNVVVIGMRELKEVCHQDSPRAPVLSSRYRRFIQNNEDNDLPGVEMQPLTREPFLLASNDDEV